MGKPITRSNSHLLPPTTTTPSSSKIPFPTRKIRKITTKPPTTPTPSIPIPIPTAQSLTLNPQLDQALAHLRASDPLLAPLINAHPPPTFFPPPTNPLSSPFLSLTRSILYQQLATSAAASIYARFLSLCGEAGVIPSTILSLSPDQLRAIGVSGRKSGYIRDLAERFWSGSLTDEAILGMGSEEEMLTRLTAVKGVGVWTVQMFMMFSLGRGDVLPVGDLGVRKGVMRLYGLRGLPNEAEMERVCEKWRPYRSVGAWYMWRLVEASGKAFNLKKKKKKAITGRGGVGAEVSKGGDIEVLADETLQEGD